MQKTILVIGATGMLGGPVVHHLKNNGFQPRILARNKEKAKKLFDKSFEVVAGDVNDTSSLETALHGCYGVHISLSPETETSGVKNTVMISSQQKLQRITYISGATTFDPNARMPHTQQKRRLENVIRESGIPYTFFCPVSAMENLPFMVRGHRASVIGRNPPPVHWFAADDLGRMVALSYSLEEAKNKKFCIHGPEDIPQVELLRRYCDVFHPEIKKISKTPFSMMKIIALLSRNEGLKWNIPLIAYIEKVGEPGDPTEANCILGPPTTTLDEWLEIRKTRLQTATG